MIRRVGVLIRPGILAIGVRARLKRLARQGQDVSAFEVGNVAATLLILRATQLLTPAHGYNTAVTLGLALYTAYNGLAEMAFEHAHADAALEAYEWAATHARQAGLPQEFLEWRASRINTSR